MSNPLLRDIFLFLSQVRPEFGEPDLIILGGSQTLDGGKHKTQDSDYDVLILFPHISRPESYTFTSSDGQRVYDLILRDKASLAYDVRQGLSHGNGTLLQIAAHGTAILDTEDQYKYLQPHLLEMHRRGPNIIHIKDMEGEIKSLRSNLFHTNKDAGFAANLSALCTRIAKVALRLAGYWTSNGKIAGRFLKQNMPEFCISLQGAFQQAIETGEKEPFYPIINEKLPALFYSIDPLHKAVAPEQTVSDYSPSPTDLGEAITAVRVNFDAMAHYLRSDNSIALDAAVTWAHIKLGNIIKPLTPERFAKKPEEYFFALGRAISGLADVEAAMQFPKPSSLTMTQRINHMLERHPHLKTDFENALRGNALGLKSAFQKTLERINYEPLDYLYRPSPVYFRDDASLLLPAHMLL